MVKKDSRKKSRVLVEPRAGIKGAVGEASVSLSGQEQTDPTESGESTGAWLLRCWEAMRET